MNTALSRFRSPAAQAAQVLNHKLNEIATGVHDLRTQANPSPTPAVTGSDDNPEAEAVDDPNVVARTAPATAASVVAVPVATTAEIATGAAAAESLPPASPLRPENDQRLPAVPDLRPELAALRSAIQQQHEATAQALRSVTALCHQKTADIARLAREIEDLGSRMIAMSRSR